MNIFGLMFAQGEGQVSVSDALGAWSSLSEEARGRLMMFGIYGLLILLILSWAIFLRKQKNKRRRIRRQHGWQQTSEESRKHRHGRHRHHSKKPELPINPTRAQSGGLPPVRPDEAPPHID